MLREHGPPLTYFRAAMVVGSASESFRTLRYLVERLPATIAPSWLKTPTQPIGIHDAVAYLSPAPNVEESTGREIQIGGPDVLSYGFEQLCPGWVRDDRLRAEPLDEWSRHVGVDGCDQLDPVGGQGW